MMQATLTTISGNLPTLGRQMPWGIKSNELNSFAPAAAFDVLSRYSVKVLEAISRSSGPCRHSGLFLSNEWRGGRRGSKVFAIPLPRRHQFGRRPYGCAIDVCGNKRSSLEVAER